MSRGSNRGRCKRSKTSCCLGVCVCGGSAVVEAAVVEALEEEERAARPMSEEVHQGTCCGVVHTPTFNPMCARAMRLVCKPSPGHIAATSQEYHRSIVTLGAGAGPNCAF